MRASFFFSLYIFRSLPHPPALCDVPERPRNSCVSCVTVNERYACLTRDRVRSSRSLIVPQHWSISEWEIILRGFVEDSFVAKKSNRSRGRKGKRVTSSRGTIKSVTAAREAQLVTRPGYRTAA